MIRWYKIHNYPGRIVREFRNIAVVTFWNVNFLLRDLLKHIILLAIAVLQALTFGLSIITFQVVVSVASSATVLEAIICALTKVPLALSDTSG